MAATLKSQPIRAKKSLTVAQASLAKNDSRMKHTEGKQINFHVQMFTCWAKNAQKCRSRSVCFRNLSHSVCFPTSS